MVSGYIGWRIDSLESIHGLNKRLKFRAQFSFGKLLYSWPWTNQLYSHYSKMSSSIKKVTCKGTLRQVFIGAEFIDKRYSQSCWYFDPQLCELVGPLTFSLVQSTLFPPPLPSVNKYTVYTCTVCGGLRFRASGR
jgi:hypothetical protein